MDKNKKQIDRINLKLKRNNIFSYKEFKLKLLEDYTKTIDEGFLHIFNLKGRLPTDYWREETIFKVAKQCNGREDFCQKEKSAYNASKRLGIYDKVCVLFGKKKNLKQTWTYEEAKIIALDYKHKTDLFDDNKALYRYMKEKEWFEDLCSHMTYNYKQRDCYWNEERCRKEIKKHESLVSFRKSKPSAYTACLRKYKYLLKPLKRKASLIATKKQERLEALIELVSGYDYEYDFKQDYPKEYEEIKKMFMKKKFFSHFKEIKYTNQEKLKRAANKYSSEDELISKNPELYKNLIMLDDKRPGVKEKVINYISKEKISRKKEWTLDELKKLTKYSRSELAQKKVGAYCFAKENGYLDELFPVRRSYEYESKFFSKRILIKEIKNYSSYNKFKRRKSLLYRFAKENGYIEEVKSYYKKIEKKIWSYKDCKKEASKYEYRTDFYKYSGSAYNKALSKGWLDDICSHMKVKGNRYNRHLYYVIFHETNSCYVGISYDPLTRLKNHFRREDSAIYRYLKSKRKISFVKSQKKEKLTDIRSLLKNLNGTLYVSTKQYQQKDIVILEKKIAKRMKRKGLNMLNQAACGALGGSEIKWTREKINWAAKKCLTRGEFAEKHRRAYEIARKEGFINEFPNLRKKTTDWTDDKVVLESKKYYCRSSFLAGCSGGAAFARKKGIFDKICKHMKPSGKALSLKKWVSIERSKYKSEKEFRKKSPYAYRARQDLNKAENNN